MEEKENKKSDFGKIKNPFSGGGNKDKKPGNGFSFYWIYAAIAVAFITVGLFNSGTGARVITFGELEKMVASDEVVKIEYNDNFAKVTIKSEALENEFHKSRIKKPMFGSNPAAGPHYEMEIGSLERFEAKLDAWGEEHDFKYRYHKEEEWLGNLFGWLLPIILLVVIWLFIMRRMTGSGGPGGQIFNIGKSKAVLFDKEKNVNVTFNDVAGLEGAKEEIEEIVDFLKNPKKYTALGAKIPKGALLVGPPGTGKTLLAKAVAGEAKVPFFSLSGSDFVEMFVGVGASRVRDLFKQAKEKAPAIIFIDEIDAIGRARGRGIAQGANDERENTLNQLLTEMDGFATNNGVILLAATNRADVLDRALLRPGRFDRQIHVDLPDIEERKEIFKVHLKPIKTDGSVDMEFLAKQTPGFSGADIANICNEAALIAARKKKTEVQQQDFLDAVDRVIGGLERKSKIITKDEKEVIAYHEAGHATVSWLLEHASPLVKVTIVPRGRSLGAAWYLPEERQITNTDQLIDEMCAALGGRAAEEITFGKISTGALSDLEKITKQAYAMVTVYGLNDKVGNISYYDSTGQSDMNFSKPWSEKTGQLIDEEVSKMIEAAYQRTKKILTENKDKLKILAELLLEKEVIFKEDVEKIFGKRPYEKKEVIETKKDSLNGNPSEDKLEIDSEIEEIEPNKEESKND